MAPPGLRRRRVGRGSDAAVCGRLTGCLFRSCSAAVRSCWRCLCCFSSAAVRLCVCCMCCSCSAAVRWAGGGGAHAGAVGPAVRLHCGARVEVARRNSLRSLTLTALEQPPRVSSRSALARADLAAALLAAPEIAPPPPTHRTARVGWRQHFAGSARKPHRASATAPCTVGVRCAQREPVTQSTTVALCAGPCGRARGRIWSAEQRRVGGRARSALRALTRGRCSSAVSAANIASWTAGHPPE